MVDLIAGWKTTRFASNRIESVCKSGTPSPNSMMSNEINFMNKRISMFWLFVFFEIYKLFLLGPKSRRILRSICFPNWKTSWFRWTWSKLLPKRFVFSFQCKLATNAYRFRFAINSSKLWSAIWPNTSLSLTTKWFESWDSWRSPRRYWTICTWDRNGMLPIMKNFETKSKKCWFSWCCVGINLVLPPLESRKFLTSPVRLKTFSQDYLITTTFECSMMTPPTCCAISMIPMCIFVKQSKLLLLLFCTTNLMFVILLGTMAK